MALLLKDHLKVWLILFALLGNLMNSESYLQYNVVFSELFEVSNNFTFREEDDTVVVRRRRPLDTVVIIGQNSEVLEQNLSQTNNSSRQGQN